MAKKKTMKEECCEPGRHHRMMGMHHQASSGVYGMGFIGALVYYISTATSFWGGVLGVLKAIIWPAMLVYKLLGI